MMSKLSPTAPFRSYKKTDDDVYQDGIASAKDWQPHWNHMPGGPYVPSMPSENQIQFMDPDWVAYCKLRAHHNKVWIDGWIAGMKVYNRNQARRILGKEIYTKLAA